MWDIVWEVIRLTIAVNHTGKSTIDFIRICPRVFIYLGLRFTSDKEDLFFEIRILLSLVIFGPRGRISTVGKKWKNR